MAKEEALIERWRSNRRYFRIPLEGTRLDSSEVGEAFIDAAKFANLAPTGCLCGFHPGDVIDTLAPESYYICLDRSQIEAYEVLFKKYNAEEVFRPFGGWFSRIIGSEEDFQLEGFLPPPDPFMT